MACASPGRFEGERRWREHGRGSARPLANDKPTTMDRDGGLAAHPTNDPHPPLPAISDFPNFFLTADPNQSTDLHRPAPQRGVAHVTDAGRDAVDAGGALDELC